MVGLGVLGGVDNQGECIRYFHAGLESTHPVVQVHLYGDVMWRSSDGRARVFNGYHQGINANFVRGLVEKAGHNDRKDGDADIEQYLHGALR